MAIDSNLDLTALGLRGSNDPATQTPKKSELGQEAFLKLMVTQLRNQDPFKPLESGEFLGQIAQFSSVAGLTELNESFAELSSSLTSNQTLQASSLLGRDVLVESSKGYLGADGSLDGAVELDASTESALLQVTDASGAVVKQMYLGAHPAGLANFSWDGTLEDGSRAPAGTYTVNAYTAVDGEPVALPVLTSSKVESVTFGAGKTGFTLSVTGLGEIALSSVRKIS